MKTKENPWQSIMQTFTLKLESAKSEIFTREVSGEERGNNTLRF